MCAAYKKQSIPLNYLILQKKTKATFIQNLLLFIHLLLAASMTRKANILFFQPCALENIGISLIILREAEVCQLVLCASEQRVCHSPLSLYGQPLNPEVCRSAMAPHGDVCSSTMDG